MRGVVVVVDVRASLCERNMCTKGGVERERERESFSPVILMNFRVPVDGAFSVRLHGWALAATTTTMGLVLRENGICYT